MSILQVLTAAAPQYPAKPTQAESGSGGGADGSAFSESVASTQDQQAPGGDRGLDTDVRSEDEPGGTGIAVKQEETQQDPPASQNATAPFTGEVAQHAGTIVRVPVLTTVATSEGADPMAPTSPSVESRAMLAARPQGVNSIAGPTDSAFLQPARSGKGAEQVNAEDAFTEVSKTTVQQRETVTPPTDGRSASTASAGSTLHGAATASVTSGQPSLTSLNGRASPAQEGEVQFAATLASGREPASKSLQAAPAVQMIEPKPDRGRTARDSSGILTEEAEPRADAKSIKTDPPIDQNKVTVKVSDASAVPFHRSVTLAGGATPTAGTGVVVDGAWSQGAGFANAVSGGEQSQSLQPAYGQRGVQLAPTEPGPLVQGTIRQIANSIRNQPLSQVIELTLDPPELGRIEIQMEVAELGMRATLAAERPLTGDLIRRHSDQLAHQLDEAGFNDVDLSFQEFGAGSDQDRENGELGKAKADQSFGMLNDPDQPRQERLVTVIRKPVGMDLKR